MRLWRNRQTRTFEGRMGNHPGSSPGNRTTHSKNRTFAKGPFFISGMGGAVTGTVQQMEYRLVPILHPLHAIGRTALSFLHTYLANNRCKASPGAARGEARTSLSLWLSSAACRAPNPQSMAKLPLPIGAVTETVQQMEYRLVPILHPLHAIGQRYFYFLFTTFGATNRCNGAPLTGHLSRRKLTILKCRIPFLEKSGISPDMTYLG